MVCSFRLGFGLVVGDQRIVVVVGFGLGLELRIRVGVRVRTVVCIRIEVEGGFRGSCNCITIRVD